MEYEEELHVTLFDRLPEACMLAVFSHLSVPSLARMAQVSKRFKHIAYLALYWSRASLAPGRLTDKGDEPAKYRIAYTNINDDVIELAAAKSQRIKLLDLSWCRELTDEGFIILAPNLKAVEWLDCSFCTGASSRALEAFAQCTTLKSLSVRGCRLIKDDGIEVAMQSLTNLTSLDISHCRYVTSDALRSIAKHVPDKLLSLYAKDLPALTDDGVRALVQSCTKLRNLDLSKCIKLSDTSMEAVAQNNKNLRRLWVAGVERVTDQGARDVARQCKSVSLLDFSDCPHITDSTLKGVGASCPAMWSMSVAGCLDVSDAGVMALAQGCPYLRVANLATTDTSDSGLKALARGCDRLQEINLERCDMVTTKGLRELMLQCPAVEKVNIVMCDQVMVSLLRRLFDHIEFIA